MSTVSLHETLDLFVPGASERVLKALHEGQEGITPQQEQEALEAFATAVVGVAMLTMLMENERLGLTMDAEGQMQLVELQKEAPSAEEG